MVTMTPKRKWIEMFNEQAFKDLIREAVREELSSVNSQKYLGYADVDQFIEISGISKRHLEYSIIPHPLFKPYIHKLEGRKRYIEIEPAMEAIRQIMKEVS